MRSIAALMFVVVLAACATSPAAEDEPPSKMSAPVDAGEAGLARSTITVDQACDENATTYCSQMQQCFPFAIEVNWGDVARCTGMVKQNCIRNLAAPAIGWTPDKLKTCVAARTALSCNKFLLRKPELADCRITGALDDGQPCRHGPQCKSGYCKIPSGQNCGYCVPPLPRGGACTAAADCAADLLCAGNSTCQPPVAPDAACDDTKPCALGSSCLGGKCKVPQGDGAACDPANGSAECDYYAQTYCNGTSKKCTKYKVAKPGESCSVPNEVVVCGQGSGCVNARCEAGGPEGTLCDPAKGIVCQSGLTCVNGSCKIFDAAECK